MRCENCQAEITFFMALRQAVPHRFRCLKCNARYRVVAPRLRLFFLGIIAAFGALVYEFAIGMKAHGPSFIVPFMVVSAGIWLLFEFLLHRHITGSGTLVRIGEDGAGRRDQGAGSSGSAASGEGGGQE